MEILNFLPALLALLLGFVAIVFIYFLFTREFIRLKDRLDNLQNSVSNQQLNGLHIMQDSIQKNILNLQQEVTRNIDRMINMADKKLQDIHGHVDAKLEKSFEKTNSTFSDVIKRLALIDEAQKKITELSTNVVSLKDILSNRSARGAFGEIQLEALIKNMLPDNHFKLQYTLSNQKRADCLLILPPPSGNIAIDAKFPLESYKRQDHKQFSLDVKKHIEDIADKYIIPNETSDGAMMFIPAESIFAEIHNSCPELIDLAHKKRVWIVSPNTMMAVLTTARAVLKDAATKKQVHLIQQHLAALSGDFSRFNKRMDDLAKHINMANRDVEQVQTSAKKITSHFYKIENVELEKENIEDDLKDLLGQE